VKRTVEGSKGSLRDLRRLDTAEAQRVIQAVSRLAETGEGDVKKLKDMGGLMRLRVGDWRVFFRFDTVRQLILVLNVVNRRDAYS
jgi:mRNA interferase RelE/StbE